MMICHVNWNERSLVVTENRTIVAGNLKNNGRNGIMGES
jgi:hypothetical protein